jgi:small nuclear ribonucleoprotein (snRNP)-like protein
MKKIVTLVIVSCLLFPSGALFAKERQGAELVITKTDGTEIKGELIAVKKNSTLLLESSSRIGGSIDVSEAKIIKIVKGSNTGVGVFFGLLAGGATEAIIGHSIGYNEPEQDPITDLFKIRDLSGALGTIVGGVIGLLAGGLFGGAIGSSIRNYETFGIKGKSQEQIDLVLRILRTQARFPDYQ